MIRYHEVKKGDILKIVWPGAPWFGKIGQKVTVRKATHELVVVEDHKGNRETFSYECGAERLAAA